MPCPFSVQEIFLNDQKIEEQGTRTLNLGLLMKIGEPRATIAPIPPVHLQELLKNLKSCRIYRTSWRPCISLFVRLFSCLSTCVVVDDTTPLVMGTLNVKGSSRWCLARTLFITQCTPLARLGCCYRRGCLRIGSLAIVVHIERG